MICGPDRTDLTDQTKPVSPSLTAADSSRAGTGRLYFRGLFVSFFIFALPYLYLYQLEYRYLKVVDAAWGFWLMGFREK